MQELHWQSGRPFHFQSVQFLTESGRVSNLVDACQLEKFTKQEYCQYAYIGPMGRGKMVIYQRYSSVLLVRTKYSITIRKVVVLGNRKILPKYLA